MSSPNRGWHVIEICVQGHLSEVWEDWFEGLMIERLENGEMVPGWDHPRSGWPDRDSQQDPK